MTQSIANLDGTTSFDVTAFFPADKANFVLIDTVLSAAGREAVYQKVTGDEEHPMTVRIGHYPNIKGNGGVGQTNISVKVQTFVIKEEEDLNWVLPCSITLASSMPGMSGVPNSADYVKFVQNVASWLLTATAGVITTDAADELKYGVVNNMAAHTDS